MARLSRQQLQAELMATFSVEAGERLEAMSRHVLALEAAPSGEAREPLIAELFRETHSLKGAARAVGVEPVEARAHELEDLFGAMRDGKLEPTPEALEGAYRALDAIAGLLNQARDPEPPAPPGAVAPPDAAPDEPADVAAAAPAQRAAPASVRIATDKLDALMAAVGELLVARIGADRRLADAQQLEATLDHWLAAVSRSARSVRGPATGSGGVAVADATRERLQDIRGQSTELRRRLEDDARRAAQITTDLHEAVRRTRMLPVASALEALPRMVRDLAHEQGKRVTLSITGGDTEVDRSVLERIKDPLTHLVRNAVDHGIEEPHARSKAGKPEATISLCAEHRGDMLVIELADDGAGIDVDAVRAAAVAKGAVTAAAAAELSDREATSLIFRSGLSTSPIITELSGRGVGLDVVRETVELLHGSIEVESRPGAGTTFTLSMPLSVSTMNCLLVEAGGQTFALPVGAVERVMRMTGEEDRGWAEGREALKLGGRPAVLVGLAELLGVVAPAAREQRTRQPAVVLGDDRHRAAFLVDRVMHTTEVVIKSLPEPLSRVAHISGATIFGPGRVAMLLSPADLLAAVERADAATLALTPAPARPAARILVAEDSITTRTLEKNILEAAGYAVEVAADGGEAWRLLQAGDYDLVVTDIEMPVVDGFELTARIRADPRLGELPVVLVTSRAAGADRERGIDAGADAYIVKGAFDQDRLLDTIRRLV